MPFHSGVCGDSRKLPGYSGCAESRYDDEKAIRRQLYAELRNSQSRKGNRLQKYGREYEEGAPTVGGIGRKVRTSISRLKLRANCHGGYYRRFIRNKNMMKSYARPSKQFESERK